MNRPAGDRGSITPLILGFFLIALLMVAGAVMASDAFTKQRELQSVCDGVALSAANALDAAAARGRPLDAALPLAAVQQAAADYLARDPDRADVQAEAVLGPDGQTVQVACRRHVRVAFGGVIGHPDGIDEQASASARSVLQ